MTDEAKIAPTTEPAPAPAPEVRADHVENTTDATRGEPLAMRAHKRKVELQAAAEKLGSDVPARKDIDLAIASIDALLQGEPQQLSHATAAQLNRLLETSKHLGEMAPTADKA